MVYFKPEEFMHYLPMKDIETSSKSADFDSRGTRVSVKFFLNKKLKPKIHLGQQRYPVYARVICKKQVCDFRVGNEEYFSQKELDKAISYKKLESFELEILASRISGLENTVNLVLELIHPFERDNFTLAKLPEILRVLNDYTSSVLDMTVNKEIKKSLKKNGYAELINIIDWKLDWKTIEDQLLRLQGKKKIDEFSLFFDGEPNFTFGAALSLISSFEIRNDSYVSTPEKLNRLIDLLLAKKLITKSYKSSTILMLHQALEFANQALKLSSKA